LNDYRDLLSVIMTNEWMPSTTVKSITKAIPKFIVFFVPEVIGETNRKERLC